MKVNVVIYPKPTAKRELITKRERALGGLRIWLLVLYDWFVHCINAAVVKIIVMSWGQAIVLYKPLILLLNRLLRYKIQTLVVAS